MAESRTIVVAMDGSKYSDEAFAWYMKNFHRKDDNVIIVNCPEYHSVIRSPLMADPSVVSDLLAEEDKRIKDLLNELGDKLRETGIGGKVKSVSGTAGEVIVKVAKDDGASAIVMGTRGMGKLRRTLMGSVSDFVLHHSPIPVLICHHKHHQHSTAH